MDPSGASLTVTRSVDYRGNLVGERRGGPAMHSVSVAAAVVRDDRVLVVRRRDNGHWEPPGGVLEPDEAILDGLRREVHEETGLDVEAETLTGVYKNLPRGIVALVFRCRSVPGRLRLNDEVTDFRWATRGEVTELLDEAYAVRLLDALAYDGKPAVRTHDGVQVLTVATP